MTTYMGAVQDRVIETANATIEKANRDIARAEARIAAIEAMGEDVYEHETVLLFYKKFSPGRQEYTYTAVKLGNWWFLSGPSQVQNKYDWGALVDFITTNHRDLEVWRVSQWERVV